MCSITKISCLILVAMVLSACSAVNPIREDHAPQLQGDQGIVGLEFRSPGTASQIILLSVFGNGSKLVIPKVPVGDRVFLFTTPAGRYCLHQFSINDHVFVSPYDNQCFDVAAGKFSYGGTFTPRVALVVEKGGGMSQEGDFTGFAALLKQQYPNVAAAYLDSKQ